MRLRLRIGAIRDQDLGVVYKAEDTRLWRLQLAPAEAMSGAKETARKTYQEFLALWKDADPGLPVFKEAKAEYDKLK